MRLALALCILLLTGCTSPDKPAPTEQPPGLEPLVDGCPVEAAELLRDLCTASGTANATLADCDATSFQYEAAMDQSGVPSEWQPQGTTPLTVQLYLQAYFCASGAIGNASIGPTFFAFAAGNAGAAPAPPQSSQNFTISDYPTLFLSDNAVLVSYLGWLGWTAESAQGTFAPGDTATTTIVGSGWQVVGQCMQRSPSNTSGAVEYYHYGGDVNAPRELATTERGTLGATQTGILTPSGGPIGQQIAPRPASAGSCTVHEVEAVSIALT